MNLDNVQKVIDEVQALINKKCPTFAERILVLESIKTSVQAQETYVIIQKIERAQFLGISQLVKTAPVQEKKEATNDKTPDSVSDPDKLGP